MPYKDIEQRRKKGREYSQRPEVKQRQKEYNKRKYHKCIDCDKLIVPNAKRCNSCAMKERKKKYGFIQSTKVRKSRSKIMKTNNPMKRKEISNKVRESNIKNGGYEKNRLRMLNGGGRKAWDSMVKNCGIKNKKFKKTLILTKDLLFKEYVVKKKSISKIARELGLCNETIKSRLNKFKIPIIKREKKIFACLDCNTPIGYYAKRCKSCSYLNKVGNTIKRKKKVDTLDKWKGFRLFINKINHLEHLRRIGFKKGCIAKDHGTRFKKGHKTCVGYKHPNWRGGIQYEPYDDNFTPKFKALIRKRDKYVCMKCDKPEHQELKEFKRKLAIHHINYDKKMTIPENCCTLCLNCNIEVNYKRPHWIKFFQSILSERYEYNYSQEGEVILNIIKDSKNG